MFETKKTLIVVYKDELLMNQLKKLVETKDDTDQAVVGTSDDSINIVSWTEKVWLQNKKAGNIQGKILFLGDIKGTDKLTPVIDIDFNEHGVKYGWAGNQAIVFADVKALTSREKYDCFLEKLSALPVPSFLKAAKDIIVKNGTDEDSSSVEAEENKKEKPAIIKKAQKAILSGAEAIEKVGTQVASKSEEVFRNKSLMKRQMLFYGVVSLYNNGLESFMKM